MARPSASEIIAGIDASHPLRDLLLESVPDITRSWTSTPGRPRWLQRWWRKHVAHGALISKLTEKDGRVLSALGNAGIGAVDLDNPLHCIAGLHPDRHVRIAAAKLSAFLDLNVTEVCNFECAYCYQRSRDDSWRERAAEAAERSTSTATWSRIIDQAVRLGVTRVKLTGGEPFTRPDFVQLLAEAWQHPELETINLVTNLSLLRGHRLRSLAEVVGDGKRLCLHLSIDAYAASPPPEAARQKTWSENDFSHLAEVVATLPGAVLTVNSMWTQQLIRECSYETIHRQLRQVPTVRWSISLPYLVRDVIEAVSTGSLVVPSFQEIAIHAARMIRLHEAAGRPFVLSIPLLWKQELVEKEEGLSCPEDGELLDHPCLPCHGAYFIIGPHGDVLDCLLTSRSQSSAREIELATLLRASGQDNPYYALRIDDVSRACTGCRYLRLCRGQCPHDRASTAPEGMLFGRDLSACSMLSMAESEIWPTLPAKAQTEILELVDPDGLRPAQYESIRTIVAGAEPLVPDADPTGKQRPGSWSRSSPARVRFHR